MAVVTLHPGRLGLRTVGGGTQPAPTNVVKLFDAAKPSTKRPTDLIETRAVRADTLLGTPWRAQFWSSASGAYTAGVVLSVNGGARYALWGSGNAPSAFIVGQLTGLNLSGEVISGFRAQFDHRAAPSAIALQNLSHSEPIGVPEPSVILGDFVQSTWQSTGDVAAVLAARFNLPSGPEAQVSASAGFNVPTQWRQRSKLLSDTMLSRAGLVITDPMLESATLGQYVRALRSTGTVQAAEVRVWRGLASQAEANGLFAIAAEANVASGVHAALYQHRRIGTPDFSEARGLLREAERLYSRAGLEAGHITTEAVWLGLQIG